MPSEANERVTTAHRAKLPYVYVRQLSPTQVRQHQESTELQYRLVNRAADFGWPRERITLIGDDLAKSSASSTERQGFQRLIAEIGLGKAGLGWCWAWTHRDSHVVSRAFPPRLSQAVL
ncbi:hypothetical protein [Azohydromonas caseinilytica]|uniref:Resolvase/invertase-type recombinase catalytic domain-containing protein n=1 Tax=Azohydromonas caseinilytica TaxID=2728836 RepID=A0A848FI80_9BURK|nr:hypothetical protein [Azohydromonas caseinilytica]NML19198.1 hypothetical protein [Azohydromonas caseinilytica]